MAVLSGNPLSNTGAEATTDGVIDMIPPSNGNGAWTVRPSSTVPPRTGAPLDGLMEQLNAHLPKSGPGLSGQRTSKIAIPDGASFETHMFANAAGQRPSRRLRRQGRGHDRRTRDQCHAARAAATNRRRARTTRGEVMRYRRGDGVPPIAASHRLRGGHRAVLVADGARTG